MNNVELMVEERPLLLVISFDQQTTNPERIAEIAKQALESDPHNTAPVTVNYVKE